MNRDSVRLEELCEIKTGAPLGRTKRINADEDSRDVKVLTPKSMADGVIVDSELSIEAIGIVKDDYFTKKEDVVIKLSTPYDSVYINSNHEGILITSFSMVLRRKPETKLDMQYLAMLLNSSHFNAALQAKSASESVVKLLRRHDIADLEIPCISLEKQVLLADLFEKVTERKKKYGELIQLDNELLDTQMMHAVWGE